MPYALLYRSSVKKEMRQLPKDEMASVVDKIQSLKTNPYPDGSAKLKGSKNLFRIRHGDYRVIYQIQKNVLIIVIIKIGHRREVYKNL